MARNFKPPRGLEYRTRNISLNIEQGTSNIEYRSRFRLERTFFYILTLGLIRSRNREVNELRYFL
jgi:hypothetical protein